MSIRKGGRTIGVLQQTKSNEKDGEQINLSKADDGKKAVLDWSYDRWGLLD